MTFIDFFAGIGGFRHGLELAGHKCVGFCEFDKFATMAYISMHLITEEQRAYLATLPLKERQKEILKEKYRNGEWYSSDIRTVTAANIPRVDCWTGGFPCQDISTAGKQSGLDGQRSTLFFELARILSELKEEDRPRFIILENVKALLTINRGRFFARVLLELESAGYDVEWFTFNSKYHGVPQNRERVYIVGHLRARGPTKIFPIKGTDKKDSVSRIDIIGHRDGYRRNTQVFSSDGITETLSTCAGGKRTLYGNSLIGCDKCKGGGLKERTVSNTITAREDQGVSNRKQSGTAVMIPLALSGYKIQQGEETAHCLNANDNRKAIGTNQAHTVVAVPVVTPDRASKRQNGRRFKENGEEMFTLTAQDIHGVMVNVPIDENSIELKPIGGVLPV